MRIEPLAKTLGYSGLIPFIIFSFGVWTGLPMVDNPHLPLLTYAAIILSFMGAIHWGLAMVKEDSLSTTQLGLSVVPALLGWLALLIPPLSGYGLLILSFIGLYLADKYICGKGLLPEWYLLMRFVLTLIVVLSLVAAALSVIYSK